jgi:Sel1 repeat
MSDHPPPQTDEWQEIWSELKRIAFELDHNFTREHCDGNKSLLKKRQELQIEREVFCYRLGELHEVDRVEATKRQALESGLVESLVATQETGTCPLCFDEIPTIIPATQCAKDSQVFHRYWCCGAIACIPCVEQREQRVMGVQERVDNGEVLSRDELEEFNLELASFGQCPFCRAPNIDNKHLVSQLQRNVEAGKAWAYYELGYLTEGGTKMVTLDRWKATELYQKAADAGHVVSMGRLGEIYGVGFPELGIPPDREKEKHYLLKAARLGYFRSQFQYAHSVLGDDNDASLIWYTLCAAQGSSTAQSYLGDYYMRPKALFRSLYWYKKAALQGEHFAQMKLASGLLNAKAFMCDGQIDLAGNSAVPEACFLV